MTFATAGRASSHVSVGESRSVTWPWTFPPAPRGRLNRISVRIDIRFRARIWLVTAQLQKIFRVVNRQGVRESQRRQLRSTPPVSNGRLGSLRSRELFNGPPRRRSSTAAASPRVRGPVRRHRAGAARGGRRACKPTSGAGRWRPPLDVWLGQKAWPSPVKNGSSRWRDCRGWHRGLERRSDSRSRYSARAGPTGGRCVTGSSSTAATVRTRAVGPSWRLQFGGSDGSPRGRRSCEPVQQCMAATLALRHSAGTHCHRRAVVPPQNVGATFVFWRRTVVCLRRLNLY